MRLRIAVKKRCSVLLTGRSSNWDTTPKIAAGMSLNADVIAVTASLKQSVFNRSERDEKGTSSNGSWRNEYYEGGQLVPLGLQR